MKEKSNKTLPSLTLIGGETALFTIQLYQDTGERFVSSGTKSELAILPYGVSNIPPLRLIKGVNCGSNANSYVEFEFKVQDTIALYGQFIYQITLKDGFRNVEVYQGDLVILQNISQNFVKNIR